MKFRQENLSFNQMPNWLRLIYNIKMNLKYKFGFTLIELLVVVAIIGILSSVVLSSISSARAKARDARRLADMHSLQVALELYRNANGSYPVTLGPKESSCYTGGGNSEAQGGWITPLTPLVSGGYLPALPVDPLNNGTVGGGNPKYCYIYDKDSTASVFNECIDTQTLEIVDITNYEYFLYVSLENPPAKHWKLYWNNSSNPPVNYCILGPHI
jgi:prepilin-type N-terminal cleavage/methylation domain-containing protein